MYEHFYGLRERPFNLTSSLKYLLLTPKHQEALSNLEYGISTNAGITLLLGEPGTGKTTLLRKVRASWTQRASADAVHWVSVNNPVLTPNELFDSIGHALQLGADCASSKSRFLRDLEQTLIEQRERNAFTVLVIDEAQSLSDVLLEEIRLLTNLERDTDKLLRLVLAGQPALGDRLNEPTLGQLKQRVALRCNLPALDLHEMAAYIAHRISLAGGQPGSVFTREAVLAIYEHSGGIPRTVNVLCDNALLTGFAADQQPIGPEIVLEVCRDFEFGSQAARGLRGSPHVDALSSRGQVVPLPRDITTPHETVHDSASRRFSLARLASIRP